MSRTIDMRSTVKINHPQQIEYGDDLAVRFGVGKKVEMSESGMMMVKKTEIWLSWLAFLTP